MIKLFARLKKSEIQKLEFISNIINASSPKFDFYLLISLALA